jgi:arabinogalactan oligomer/maltooligosaccharide transport system permease protein
MPIFFTASAAFTNYGGTIVPPKLIDWVGFDNFRKIFTISEYVNTILRILLWNILWAAGATLLNYFGGLTLALLYNTKLLKLKRFWRVFPMLAYAIPSFITLIGFRFMFSDSGPVIGKLQNMGVVNTNFSFLGFDAMWSIRLIGFVVCAWISVPSIMFLATGILSNASADVYEAAKLDGANAFQQFRYITLPFVLFSTMPVVISSFIGNFNNFGIFYFLRGTTYMDGYFYASNTDLLINWMFNLTVDKKLYALGSALSILLFVFMAIFSLAAYMNSAAYKKEDTYK